MSVLSQFGAAGVKSIQRGTISFSGSSSTASITAVTTSKSEISLIGFSITNGDPKAVPSLELTNSTTVTARRGSGALGTTVAAFQVVEYF